MKKLLIVIDMQNDFIDGNLGTEEAKQIVPKIVDRIKTWDGDVVTTQDTHFDNYLETKEGKNLPIIHCIKDTNGHYINANILHALRSAHHVTALNKTTFGSLALPAMIRGSHYDYIEIVGVCTDICIISNALILKAYYPEIHIVVNANCCAGSTPKKHQEAISVMESCQIDIIR